MALPYPLRGREAKERFCREYVIRCIWHGVLKPGESERCCCGKPLQQEFFKFAYDSGKILWAGARCGRQFLEIAALPTPPIFDPFGLLAHTTSTNTAASGTSESSEYSIPQINWEMLYALSMLLAIWGPSHKGGYLKNMSEKLHSDPQMFIQDALILTLNKAVRSTAARRNEQLNLRQMYARSEGQGLTMRNIHFSNLEKKLLTLGEVSQI